MGTCPSDVTVRCCQLVLQAVRQPGLLGSAEPRLAAADWGLGGSWDLVVLRTWWLSGFVDACCRAARWSPGSGGVRETTLSTDPPYGGISVAVGGMEMLTWWCVLGASMPPRFLLRTQEPALLAPKLCLSRLIHACQDFSLRFNL